jgi:glucosamine 6-phosphate synthetase-like amidotransferase/phosphosugar isomerase protein
MCGIVCYFGQADGIARVLEALHLLEYRAPDSSGLATIDENGRLAVRRSVGSPRRLVAKMSAEPLYCPPSRESKDVAMLLRRQGLALTPGDLRDVSVEAGYNLKDLYRPGGLQVGIGDAGRAAMAGLADPTGRFSSRMRGALRASGGLTSPDYDLDPLAHAFRLVAAHVAAREACDPNWKAALDRALQVCLPGGAYASWREAWEEEVACRAPGLAFAMAVRRFQETFPGLAQELRDADWERLGGLTAQAMAQIVLGHGRWAMVGAVTDANAHPFLDRSGTRALCENGSHNASLMQGARAEQERWWRARGLPTGEAVHRSENTSEVLVYEWEHAFLQIDEGETLAAGEVAFLSNMAQHGISDLEEQALRLAMWRLRAGNAHACALYSQRHPDRLYVSSQDKPIAVAMRTHQTLDGEVRQEVMVASDVNAALLLWQGDEVESAAQRLQALRSRLDRDAPDAIALQAEIETILAGFEVEVVFLDADLYGGQELLACLENEIQSGKVRPCLRITRYDGTPLAFDFQRLRLDPSMSGKNGHQTYTEAHIAEIPQVFAGLVRAYTRESRICLDGVWQHGRLVSPGLNRHPLEERFGRQLERLQRLLLVGEGSSWRDAQAAAILFRQALPQTIVTIYRPVELLNLGESINPETDLAVEVSWSGTTDSLLKVDNWLAEMDVLRLGVTGRPQSDLGRHTALSAGTLDVRSGMEASVATVKGYHAILVTLDLLALQLAQLQANAPLAEPLGRLVDELTLVVPVHVKALVNDADRRKRLREAAFRCRQFNKVAVIGNSPAEVEGELKIEELAQVVALHMDCHATSLRGLIEHSAMVDEDRSRTLFIINATSAETQREADPILHYLRDLGVFCLVHTTPHEELAAWQTIPGAKVFVSPKVSDLLQPLIDVLFFFDLAVYLAYARGLSPEEIDQPRNLAKSVTTTGAERRRAVEGRLEFRNPSLEEFATAPSASLAWDAHAGEPTRAALRATIALRSALSVINEPLPARLMLDSPQHLLIFSDDEATENAARMAAGSWQQLLGLDVTVYRSFIDELPQAPPDTALLRMIRAGAVLSIRGEHTIALPADLSPFQWELLGTLYLNALAVRLARQHGVDTHAWEVSLSRLPLIIEQVLSDVALQEEIDGVLSPLLAAGYDKAQIVGGGQDFAAASSIARSLRSCGFLAEALYTDSAWHGPLATVGGGDADHDSLIVILATDPLFQAAALVDTQVYRARRAPVVLVVPRGNQHLPAVQGVEASALLALPPVPRPLTPLINATLGEVLARQIAAFWDAQVGK